jgi:hypothetical protein
MNGMAPTSEQPGKNDDNNLAVHANRTTKVTNRQGTILPLPTLSAAATAVVSFHRGYCCRTERCHNVSRQIDGKAYSSVNLVRNPICDGNVPRKALSYMLRKVSADKSRMMDGIVPESDCEPRSLCQRVLKCDVRVANVRTYASRCRKDRKANTGR